MKELDKREVKQVSGGAAPLIVAGFALGVGTYLKLVSMMR